MRHAIETVAIFLALGAWAWGMVKLLNAGAFTVTRKPPAVRVSPDLIQQMRDEVVFRAIKQGPRVVRADFQRGNRA
jgi:hypothetical protein